VLVELAQLQDQEVGDGTTSVVIVAAELLKRANELVKKNIHPTVVMAGYRLACKEAVKFIKENLIVKADSLGADNLINAGRWLLTHSLTHSTYVLTQLMSSLNLCPHSTYVLTQSLMSSLNPMHYPI
jgi:chaperonin GroEL (HSP60 family)